MAIHYLLKKLGVYEGVSGFFFFLVMGPKWRENNCSTAHGQQSALSESMPVNLTGAGNNTPAAEAGSTS